MQWIARRLKRVMPTSLFARALLIVVLPTLMVQMVTAVVFYERHWDHISKHMALALANELHFILRQAENPRLRLGVMKQSERFFNIPCQWQPRADDEKTVTPVIGQDRALQLLAQHLRPLLRHPFSLQLHQGADENEHIALRVHFPDGHMQMMVSRKRITSPTTAIYFYWAVGSAILFLLVALRFFV